MKIREVILPVEQAINEEWYKPWTWWDDPKSKGTFGGDPADSAAGAAAGAATGILLRRISRGRAILKAQKLGPINPKLVKAPFGTGTILWMIGVGEVAGNFYADMTALEALYMSNQGFEGKPYHGEDYQKDRQMREGLLVAQMGPLIAARLGVATVVTWVIRALMAVVTLGATATIVAAPAAIAAGLVTQVFLGALATWLGTPEGARWMTKNFAQEMITVGTITDSFWMMLYETVKGSKYYEDKKKQRENPINGTDGTGPKDIKPASDTPGADWIGNTATDPRQVKIGSQPITDINGKLIPGALGTPGVVMALKNNTDDAVAKVAKAKQLAVNQ